MEEKKYKAVYNDIIAKIRTREIKVGDKLPTTKELAARYGVSVITIEHAMKKLKEMNIVYSVKKAGTFVNGKKSEPFKKVIACLLPNAYKDSMRIYESACVTALLNNCFIECIDVQADEKKEREALKNILNGDYYGVLYFSTLFTKNIDLVSQIQIAGIPLVFVDCAIDGISAPLVTADGIQGERLLIDYLVSKGHKNIAFYEYYQKQFTQTERLRFEGYCKGLIANGIPVRREFIYTTKRNYNFVSWYESLDPKPTAVVCTNDVRARKVIDVMERHGYQVPDDLSVVGFDYSNNDKRFLDFTTIKQNFREIGELAVKELLNAKEFSTSRSIFSSVSLNEGKTVKNLNI